tara:strand:- start:255 stop:527 length:273 start_codon:yes stop_codon:yes gene_type:complete
MTKRTKTDLVSNVINTLLLDNAGGEISPEDLRTGFIDTADSVVFWDNTKPASATASCTVGEVKIAATDTIYHLYVCVATDTWRRAELGSF